MAGTPKQDGTQTRPAADRSKKAYGSPTVKELGPIEELTGAGSGSIMEHGMGAAAIYSQG